MQETGVDRRARVVADAETEQVTVERKRRGHILHQDQHVSHAERTGPEAGNQPARPKRRVSHRRAVKRLQAIARGIEE
jgi:hypothetical protein